MRRPRVSLRFVVFLLVGIGLCGCAPARMIVAGPEADRVERFFAGLRDRVDFPVKASFSGTVVPAVGNIVPFVAGVSALSTEAETVGLYDPLGRGVAFLTSDGRSLTVSRGPAADLAGFHGAMPPIDTGPVSLARILSGAPGYAIGAAEAGGYRDGAWSLSDRRQTLRSDPGRRFLAGAEYRFPGLRVDVEYPGRETADPPERIVLSVSGVKFTLRRDPE